MTDTLSARVDLVSAYGSGTPPDFVDLAGWYTAGDGYGGTFQYMAALSAPYTDPFGRPVVVDAQARVWLGVVMEPEPKIINPSPDNAIGLGDSIMVGNAASSPSTNSFLPVLSAYLGHTPVNMAVSGTGMLAADTLFFTGFNSSTAKRGGILIIEDGHNDVLKGNSLSPVKIKNELTALLCDWFAETSTAANAFSFSGWSISSGFNEKAIHTAPGTPRMLSSSSSGNLITGSFSGPNVVLRSMSDDGAAANSLRTIDMWIDDPGTYLTADRKIAALDGDFQYDSNPIDAAYNATYDLGHLATPIFDLSLGSHTFGIKSGGFGSGYGGSGGAICLVDTVDTLRAPHLCDPVLVYLPSRPSNYAPFSPITAADFDNADQAIMAAIKPFQRRGYPIALARTNDFLDPANIKGSPDWEHPLTAGHMQMVCAGFSVIHQ